MASPFPGMDPYLEQFWRDVHARLIIYAADQLQGRLPGDLRARLGLPRGAKMQLTSVRSDMHGQIAHVTAFQPMSLTGAGLRGLQILVPAVARVQTRGAAIVGLLGEPAPVDKDSQAHAQAFAQALVANGDLDMGKGVRAMRNATRPTSHVVKKVGGKPTIVRRGFVCGCRPA